MKGLGKVVAPDHVPIAGRMHSMLAEFMELANAPMVVFGGLWFIWLVVGTAFYCHQLSLTLSKGFYMAVNCGYSIGWGDIYEGPGSQLFSIFYVLCGSSFVAAALGFFAQGIIADRDNWYTNELQKADFEAKMEEHKNDPHWQFIHWCIYHWLEVRAIVLWVFVILVATAFAKSLNPEWPLVTAIYFALSSLSTGGLASVPAGSPDWYYGMVGVYAALGVPVMAVAMATLAALFMSKGDDMESTVRSIREPVTELEVQMLEDFNLCDSDGTLDKSEFIILCMVRTGAATPGLIKMIVDYFDELDDDGSGGLSLEELLDPTNAREPPTKEEMAAKMASMIKRAVDYKEEKDKEDKDGTASSVAGAEAREKSTQRAERRKTNKGRGDRSQGAVSPVNTPQLAGESDIEMGSKGNSMANSVFNSLQDQSKLSSSVDQAGAAPDRPIMSLGTDPSSVVSRLDLVIDSPDVTSKGSKNLLK